MVRRWQEMYPVPDKFRYELVGDIFLTFSFPCLVIHYHTYIFVVWTRRRGPGPRKCGPFIRSVARFPVINFFRPWHVPLFLFPSL